MALLGSLAFSFMSVLLILGACAPAATPVPAPTAPEVKLAGIDVRFVGKESAFVEFELNVTNPNDFLITIESMSVETYLEDFSPTTPVGASPIPTFYIPGGKTASIKYPVHFTLARDIIAALIGTKGMSPKESAALGAKIFAAIKEGKARWRIEGLIQAKTEGGSVTVPFSLRP